MLFVQRLWMSAARKGVLLSVRYYYYIIPGRHLLDQLNKSDRIVINDLKDPTTFYGSTLDLVIVSPQVFTTTHWHLTSDHLANGIDITISFQKIPGIHIPPRWVTESRLGFFCGETKKLSRSRPVHRCPLEDRLQLLIQKPDYGRNKSASSPNGPWWSETCTHLNEWQDRLVRLNIMEIRLPQTSVNNSLTSEHHFRQYRMKKHPNSLSAP